MIIYEVNILIPESIYKDYLIWLKNHIKQMLTIDGFLKHKIFKIKSNNKNNINICVHYYINSIKQYDSYIDNRSYEMRNSKDNKFINKVKIARRILSEEID